MSKPVAVTPPSYRRKILFLGCLVCLCPTILAEFQNDSLSPSSSNHVKRSFEFPTLFYPGPDNKFITLSPSPEAAHRATSSGAGRNEGSRSPLRLTIKDESVKKKASVHKQLFDIESSTDRHVQVKPEVEDGDLPFWSNSPVESPSFADVRPTTIRHEKLTLKESLLALDTPSSPREDLQKGIFVPFRFTETNEPLHQHHYNHLGSIQSAPALSGTQRHSSDDPKESRQHVPSDDTPSHVRKGPHMHSVDLAPDNGGVLSVRTSSSGQDFSQNGRLHQKPVSQIPVFVQRRPNRLEQLHQDHSVDMEEPPSWTDSEHISGIVPEAEAHGPLPPTGNAESSEVQTGHRVVDTMGDRSVVRPGPFYMEQLFNSQEETEVEDSYVEDENGLDDPPLPETSFTCAGLKPGYHADLETGCKVFHICHHGRQHTFFCSAGTLFSQQLQVCDWPQRVTC